MVPGDVILKLSGTAEGRTKLAVYAYLRFEYGGIQHGKHPPGQHSAKCGRYWFFASWNELAAALGLSRDGVRKAVRGLREDGMLEMEERQRHNGESDSNRMRCIPFW